MTRLTPILCVLAVLLTGLSTLALGCDKAAEAKVAVEKLPDIKPSLPAVPTIPPPPFPTQYADQSYSIFGLRRTLRKTIDTDVVVTGYIAKVYVPPECPPKQKCPVPPAPHIWLADTQGEQDETKLLILAGYAENQSMIDEAVEAAKKGKKPTEEELKEQQDMGLLPIPTDFNPGAKLKVTGRFAYIGGSGFQSSEGVLDYRGHETLEPAPEAAAAK